MSGGDTTMCTSLRETSERQPSGPTKDFSNCWSCSSGSLTVQPIGTLCGATEPGQLAHSGMAPLLGHTILTNKATKQTDKAVEGRWLNEIDRPLNQWKS